MATRRSCLAGASPLGLIVLALPTADGWAADVNNRTVDAIHVEVQASCATARASYQLVNASFTNPAGSHSINSTSATGGLEPTGWQAVMNNNGNRASTTQVYTVCGHERRAAFATTSAEATVPPGETVQAFMFCPQTFVVTGGGAITTAFRDVSLQQIIAARQGPFVVAARNAGSTPATVTAQAVCGRT